MESIATQSEDTLRRLRDHLHENSEPPSGSGALVAASESRIPAEIPDACRFRLIPGLDSPLYDSRFSRLRRFSKTTMSSGYNHCFDTRTIMRLAGVLLFASLALVPPAYTQTAASGVADQGNVFFSFLAHWDERALRSQLNQPNWLTPVDHLHCPVETRDPLRHFLAKKRGRNNDRKLRWQQGFYDDSNWSD